MNKRIIILLVAVLIGLSAHADYAVQTYQPLYPAPIGSYSAVQQPYAQQYNQPYYQNPYQAPYNAYQSPYYSYGNNVPYRITNNTGARLNNTSIPQQIVKNIGQSMLFSMMRGY